ncbi:MULTISPECIES: C40 family peptidase [Rhodanobacter]|jgi:cell wall-associated NlpC family hydrolase|uniref:C40 family peptidase n=1 Tax=Rhodanobacter ginsenosidimutans TaxID=490571 RepID=A0ABW0JU47_9GAMM|nr:C40 family peptidase [Rhodanobacter sp. Root627]KRA32985.1 hydrolase [Rhodanobacter sp. Root627]
MPSHRLTVAAAVVAASLCGSLHAAVTHSAYIDVQPATTAAAPAVAPLPIFASVSLAGADAAAFPALLAHRNVAHVAPVKPIKPDMATAADEEAEDVVGVTDLRKALIAMAMKLRDTRYVRGGRDPSTGFDCSGFVRYVFAHAVGMQLPTNSAAQFLAGLKVKRADMKPGDLVFFRTSGKHRVSHVGIYISDGRFIHSPTTGKSVEISSLETGYWAKRFVGAKRPEAMAMAAHNG